MQQLPVATTLFETIGSYLAPAEIERVQKAYRWAEHAHAGQLRQSGEPYLIHPVATARLLADYHLDSATLAAALLHDVCEDTPFTLAEIRKNFGDEIAQLVDGVTKLSQVRLKKTWHEVYHGTHAAALGENFESFDRHVETLRKMFIAMSQDIRVVLIKLADRLHNMETLDALAPEKQRRMAQETLEVYAPLADRLGIGSLKGRLRDLAFPYAFPDEYVWLTKLIAPLKNRKEASVERVRRVVLKRLAAQGVRGEAHGRAKHIYSLWKKLLR
ncbi:bifunctional (p)ppGpp synthetase/guanosine-3',5'-bis(diphosphate) 3'-pyrophosphohydrolase, partial [Candidatus Berkelbacteria bacterium]|nr:bifunctional (p)ppGpp synthetase/guanosine-3',5'-bis(diphosphate) 3'-pyrophosphohydrolase [Candidatus Berkelbacteria bacterium]